MAVSNRYRMAEKRDKSRVLSEFVALTGYHPKYAIRILNRPPPPREFVARGSPVSTTKG